MGRKSVALSDDSVPTCVFTLSSQASSSMSRASMDTALLWSCSCVTSSSMPQLLKNSTLARSRTRRCLVAYNLHGCSVREGELWEKARTFGMILSHLEVQQQCSDLQSLLVNNKQTKKNTMSKVKHSLDRSWTNDSVMFQM